jgi:hypothetical protein
MNTLCDGVQEFAALPLRLSRQLTLDTVNAAAVALGRLLGARRAAAGPNSAPGEAAGAARVAAAPALTGHASLHAPGMSAAVFGRADVLCIQTLVCGLHSLVLVQWLH